MANEVSLRIKIDGSNEFKTVTVDAKELGGAIDEVTSSVQKLDKTIVESAAWSQIIDGVNSVVQQLNSAMLELTSAYSAQAEAEAKLATAMRNTMGASDEEIEAIKRLTAEQQQIGIVGDEVQLAASQELATYLELSSSLEKIIPTMNDMIAQQLGMGASAESATQIATMLGKVMNGQTEALSRYGYKFDEAQKYILQFGDESERAAILCQVVAESVGGMNEALADTDAGHFQQVSNAIGDAKEKLGQMAMAAQPLVSKLAAVGNTAAGIMKLRNAIQSLAKIEKVAELNTRMQAAAQKLLKFAGYEAAAGTLALKVATAALYATMTMGISLVIEGLVAAFSALSAKGKDAAEGMEEVNEAAQAYDDAFISARSEMAEYIVKLEDLIKHKGDEKAAVAELNEKYGETFGYHKTAAAWYDVLLQKSKDYARQLGLEAKAKVISAQLAELELRYEVTPEMEQQVEQFEANRKEWIKLPRDMWPEAPQKYAEVKEIQYKRNELAGILNESAAIGKSLSMPATSGGQGSSSIRTIADDIEDYNKKIQSAMAVQAVFHKEQYDETAQLKAMRSGLESLISKYGLEDDAIKKLIQDYRDFRSAVAGSQIAKIGSRSSLLPDTALSVPAENLIIKPSQNAPEKQLEGVKVTAGQAAEAVSSLGQAMSSLGGIVGEGAKAWLDWGANLLNSIAQAIPAIVALTKVKEKEAVANTAAGATGAGAAVASIPIVGPVLAIAAIASVLAAMLSIPKFASGGLAYGPTVGVFGEYAGSASNPEVVAPLDRLQSIIGQPGMGSGKVEFEISGRTLKGILKKMDRFDSRG